MDRLADRVHTYAATQKHPTTTLRVTYVQRPPPRTLHPTLEKQIFSSLQSVKSVSLQTVDFAKLTFQEQLQIIRNTDVLIGVHGNGLSHSLFLPRDSAVIELFPPGFHALDYRLFAEMRGLDYTAVLPDKGIIDRDEAYRLGAYGDANVGVSSLSEREYLIENKGFAKMNPFSFQGETSFPYLSGYTWVSFCNWKMLNRDYGSGPSASTPNR